MKSDTAIAITGNLSDLRDIILPEEAFFWPPAPAWYAVFFLLAFFLFRAGYKGILKYRANQYRRDALKRLKQLEKKIAVEKDDRQRHRTVTKIPVLLKQAALSAYNRETVAALSQERWLDFLDNCGAGTRFSSKTGKLLLLCAYGTPEQIYDISHSELTELITLIRKWLLNHQPGEF